MPGAGLEEVDALLVGMERPCRSDAEARERADLLHQLIEDPWLGGFRGGDGRRVDQTAARTLVALGEPYASELSPQERKVLGWEDVSAPGTVTPSRPPVPGPLVFSTFQKVGVVLAALMGVSELAVAAAYNDKFAHVLVPLALCALALTTALPVLLMALSAAPRDAAFITGRAFVILAAVPWAVLEAALLGAEDLMSTEGAIGALVLMGRVAAVSCLLRGAPEAPDAPGDPSGGA